MAINEIYSSSHGSAEGHEVAIPQNLFVALINDNLEAFDAFTEARREERAIERKNKTKFDSLFEDLMGPYRNQQGFGGKRIEHLRALWSNIIFKDDAGKYTVSSSGEMAGGLRDNKRAVEERVSSGAMRLPEGNLEPIKQLTVDHIDAIAPVLEMVRERTRVIADAISAALLADYKCFVDMLDFLSNPRYASLRDRVWFYFRELADKDAALRKAGNKDTFLAVVKRHWDAKAQGEFVPVIFERFWKKISSTPGGSVIIELVQFGARIGKRGRDESAGDELTVDDIKRAVGKQPFSSWPFPLREKYTSFAKDDTAYLMSNISSKLGEIFRSQEPRSVVLGVKEETVSKKRDGVAEEESAMEVPQDDTESEEDRRGEFSLATLKPVLKTGGAGWEVVPLDEIGVGIELLIDKLVKRTMRNLVSNDIRRMILEILKAPFHPTATRKIEGQNISIERESHDLRRFSPNGIIGLELEYKDSSSWRISYVVVEQNSSKYVSIIAIDSHDDYVRRWRKDR